MRKMSISSMCTRLGILACLFAVLPSGTTAEGQIISKIRCLNNPFYGEALLITTVDQPLRFQCDIDIHPSVPENYAQTRIDFNWSVTSGTIQKTENTCVWTNPSPGLQTIQVKGKVTYESTQTGGLFSSKPEDIVFPFQSHLKCLMPIQADMDKSAKINGFEIGKYPNPLDPFDLRAASNPDRIKNNYTTYLPPTLFYEVTPETYFLKIFDQYALGEFDLDPRFSDLNYPRYIAIHPKILRKLSLLRTLMNEKGVPVSKFNLIYGFRSPHYNLGAHDEDGDKTLKSSFSIHMYGLALDIIVDEDHDMVIDDLNKDGRIDHDDAMELRKYVDELDRTLRDQGSDLVGAAFTYRHHDYWERGEYAQTPYVHFDARGFLREDGTLIRGAYADKIGITRRDNPYRIMKPIPAYPF
jgi:hypothetical protein